MKTVAVAVVMMVLAAVATFGILTTALRVEADDRPGAFTAEDVAGWNSRVDYLALLTRPVADVSFTAEDVANW